MHTITTIDVHVAGEPLRVVTSGFPEPGGQTILEKRRYCQVHLDHLRKALMLEPRGHQDMYGCLLVQPCHPEADLGVLFFHNEGYSTMCGHGIIGLVTVLLEHQMYPITEPESIIRMETPSGLVTAKASVNNGKVKSVVFHNVPSFVVDLDQVVEVPGIGPVHYDLAFGGAFYGFCRAEYLRLELIPKNARKLAEAGMTIKQAIMDSRTITHPTEPDLGFLYGIIFVGSPLNANSQRRNAYETEFATLQICLPSISINPRCPIGDELSRRTDYRWRRHHCYRYTAARPTTGRTQRRDDCVFTWAQRYLGNLRRCCGFGNRWISGESTDAGAVSGSLVRSDHCTQQPIQYRRRVESGNGHRCSDGGAF